MAVTDLASPPRRRGRPRDHARRSARRAWRPGDAVHSGTSGARVSCPPGAGSGPGARRAGTIGRASRSEDAARAAWRTAGRTSTSYEDPGPGRVRYVRLLCGDPLCVNPWHRRIGTPSEIAGPNARSAERAMERPSCQNGPRVDGRQHRPLRRRAGRVCMECKRIWERDRKHRIRSATRAAGRAPPLARETPSSEPARPR
jgi:hypothetical protein